MSLRELCAATLLISDIRNKSDKYGYRYVQIKPNVNVLWIYPKIVETFFENVNPKWPTCLNNDNESLNIMYSYASLRHFYFSIPLELYITHPHIPYMCYDEIIRYLIHVTNGKFLEHDVIHVGTYMEEESSDIFVLPNVPSNLENTSYVCVPTYYESMVERELYSFSSIDLRDHRLSGPMIDIKYDPITGMYWNIYYNITISRNTFS